MKIEFKKLQKLNKNKEVLHRYLNEVIAVISNCMKDGELPSKSLMEEYFILCLLLKLDDPTRVDSAGKTVVPAFFFPDYTMLNMLYLDDVTNFGIILDRAKYSGEVSLVIDSEYLKQYVRYVFRSAPFMVNVESSHYLAKAGLCKAVQDKSVDLMCDSLMAFSVTSIMLDKYILDESAAVIYFDITDMSYQIREVLCDMLNDSNIEMNTSLLKDGATYIVMPTSAFTEPNKATDKEFIRSDKGE